MDAFDADALIYAAVPDHPLGRRVATLLPVDPLDPGDPPAGVGSVLLLPELLGKPLREGSTKEVDALVGLLSRIDIRPVDMMTAHMAASLSASYKLRAADAVHLATAIAVGADRFLTNNRKDFPTSISEIEITYPDMLDDPAA